MRVKNEYLLCLDTKPITPAAFLKTARKFEGMRYAYGAAIIWGEEAGRFQGETDCAGLAVLVCHALGLTNPKLDLSFPSHVFGAPREVVLARWLTLNFTPRRSCLADVGDLIFLGAERHVALMTQAGQRARFIAAQNDLGFGKGRVLERFLKVEDEIRRAAWRLNNFQVEEVNNG